MLKKIFFSMIIATLTFIPGLNLFSIGPGDDLLKFGDVDIPKKELNLNADQIKKIESISDEAFKQIQSKQIDLERTNIDIKEQMLKDRPDLSVLKKLIDKKHSILSEIDFLQIKKDLGINSLLTSEQASKSKKIMMNGRKRIPQEQFPFRNGESNKFPMDKRQNGPPENGNKNK